MAAVQTLSEHASKQLLAGYGIVSAREALVDSPESAAEAASELGFPVVLKLCGEAITHKSERGLVRLGLDSADAVKRAAGDLLAQRRPEDGETALLVAEMVRGHRELIAGLVQDPQFGPCVMLGLGGVLAEALGDVVFAAAPVSAAEASRLPRRLAASRLLTEPFRGEPAVDEQRLAEVVVGPGRRAVERPDVRSVDVNPLVVRDGVPIAVDALVVLDS
jgi:acetyl-CoA synthetase (ADP-forming)